MNRQSEASLIVELEQQIYSFMDICALYETTPTARAFINYLDEAYD